MLPVSDRPVLPSLPLARAGGLVLATLLLSACTATPAAQPPAPMAPTSQGPAETVPVPGVPAYVDHYAELQQAGTAGVGLLSGFGDLWTPGATWDTGQVRNAAVLGASLDYSVRITGARTDEQEVAAYYDDRQNQTYSIQSGLGPLTDAYRSGARAATSIKPYAGYGSFAAFRAATSAAREDDTNTSNAGGDVASPDLGDTVKLVGAVRSVSTSPAKAAYLYPRPWRQSSAVKVSPSLERAKSPTPATDGGFPSGHTNGAYLAALALAYAVPERYQELLTRASALGDNRIVAGMHSTVDVMGARLMATAHAAAILNDPANAALKANGYAQAQRYLQARTGTTANTFFAAAHSAPLDSDPYTDPAANRAAYLFRMTYGLPRVGTASQSASVPKGAEVLLETRLPYLDAAQRRAVLKTTALDSGFPVLDDPEGWGRLNLVAAADGYGALSGDVQVNMDASRGGFNASDLWRNDISGAGQLIKRGSGQLRLSGTNTYAGGTWVQAGTLEGDSAQAFGRGDVYISGGTLVSDAPGVAQIAGRYGQQAAATLDLRLEGDQDILKVGGDVVLAGGTLNVVLAQAPAAGQVVPVIQARTVQGRFDRVTVNGAAAEATYTASGVQVRVGR